MDLLSKATSVCFLVVLACGCVRSLPDPPPLDPDSIMRGDGPPPLDPDSIIRGDGPPPLDPDAVIPGSDPAR